jgi:5'-nucleotidase
MRAVAIKAAATEAVAIKKAVTKILVTNDDGWDAAGLAALKTLAAEFGEVHVLAPREPHSYAGHRVTTHEPLTFLETAPREFTLSGTPADCVRAALTSVFEDIDWVFAGINHGGNLGADLYTSATVAAAREAAFLGKPSIAISQYIKRALPLDWSRSCDLARPVLARLLAQGCPAKGYWNVNLPHTEGAGQNPVAICDPDNEPLDVRFYREGTQLRYGGSYVARPRTPGRDVDLCFAGAITVSRLQL